MASGTAERFAPYRQMIRAQARSQAAYRASFIADIVGSTLITTFDLVTVIVLFRVTPDLGGFDFGEAFLMASIAAVAFALADAAIGNIDRLRDSVRSGRLDALLVRPLGLLRQLVTADLQVRKAGRVIQSVVALVLSVFLAHVPASPANITLLVMAPLAGAVFFGAIFVIGSTVAFWWIDSGEFANGFTYGGRDFTTYPVTVYGQVFRRIFALGLGFAFVAYYPALVLLGRSDPLGLPAWTGWLCPLVAAIAAGIASAAWRFGVAHYRSTGS